MSTKKEKHPLQDCDARIKDIRIQLNEQLKCYDLRTDARITLLTDVQEFLKRKAELHLEYARKLDTLSDRFLTKQRNLLSSRKEQTDATESPVQCWTQILELCHRESKDHATMSTVYQAQLLPRLQMIIDDVTRLHKKHKEMSLQSHEDLLGDLRKLYEAIQLYQVYWNECLQAESKYRQIEKQQGDSKLKEASFRKLEKQREKRLIKYAETKEKCVKARNEYILQLQATNATLNKYYDMDIGDLLELSNIGYHNLLERALNTLCEAEFAAQSSKLTGINQLKQSVDELDPGRDKTIFLEHNCSLFAIPQLFVYTGHPDDKMEKVSLILPKIYKEYEKRCKELEQRMQGMTCDQEESKKNLTTSFTAMSQLSSTTASDVAPSFLHSPHSLDATSSTLPTTSVPPPVQPFATKQAATTRSKLLETEAFYIQNFQEHLRGSSQLNRLEAKHKVLEKALKDSKIEVPVANTSTFARTELPNVAVKPGKSAHGKQPKFRLSNINHFDKDMMKYLKEFGRSIPLVVESCVRMINLNGLHHQGIFRVPGAHQEIMEMKSMFARGEDPITFKDENSDVNTVSGLLKLYFRELDEKLFPHYVFDDLVQCAKTSDLDERSREIAGILATLPEAVLVVMRYLFAFLNHLSENSDENMMDAYNIAVCFGPTLMPVPDGYDQVSTQANVNEIIKTVVLKHDQIFPSNMKGPVYEKMMTSKEFGNSGGAVEQVEALAHSSGSDDESEHVLEGLAKYDYKGRSERELSFLKGDVLTLYRQVNDDWWEGSFKRKDGLIPNAYIIVQDTTRLSSESVKTYASSQPSMKTRSLDRRNNVQDYLKHQRVFANIATKAAQQGLVRSGDPSKGLRSSSLKGDLSSPIEEAIPAVDPASLSFAERMAHFRRSSKPSKDWESLQNVDEAIPVQAQSHQVEGERNRGTLDLVVDASDTRSKQKKGSPSNSATITGSGGCSPLSSGRHLRSISTEIERRKSAKGESESRSSLKGNSNTNNNSSIIKSPSNHDKNAENTLEYDLSFTAGPLVNVPRKLKSPTVMKYSQISFRQTHSNTAL